MALSARMPDLGALEVLLAVAGRGSLKAAARDLGVTQQAVSARVASLEAQTGVQLVVRSRHGSTLTSSGVVVSEWAARLLEVAAEVDAGLGALRQDSKTHLRVSASLTIAEHLLPGWLVSMRAAAVRAGGEAVDVTFTAANSDAVIEQVRNGQAEVGFVEGPKAPRGVHGRIVGHDALVLVVRRDHPWARRHRPVTAAELAATPLVTREGGSGTRRALVAALESHLGPGFPTADPVLQLSTTSAVRSAVNAGAGPAVLSELALADDLATHRLRRVPLADIDLHRDLRAVWIGPRRPPAGAVRSLIDHIASRPAASSARVR